MSIKRAIKGIVLLFVSFGFFFEFFANVPLGPLGNKIEEQGLFMLARYIIEIGLRYMRQFYKQLITWNPPAPPHKRSIDPYYDLVIDIRSLKDIGTVGWKIKYQNLTLANELMRETEGTILGVLGLYNKGKTYVINKLCDLELPVGFLTRTVGLSFKIPKSKRGQNMILIDIAGSQTPTEPGELMDRLATDMFIKETVLELSNVILVVVNQLTLEDQRYLSDLVERTRSLHKPNKNMQIYIIHNLLNLRSIAHVKHAIKTDIIQAFKAKQYEVLITRTVNNTLAPVFKSDNFIHLVFAAEGSEAGNYYNCRSQYYLQQKLFAETVFQKLNFINSVRKIAEAKLPYYFHLQSEEDRVPPQARITDKSYYEARDRVFLQIPYFIGDAWTWLSASTQQQTPNKYAPNVIFDGKSMLRHPTHGIDEPDMKVRNNNADTNSETGSDRSSGYDDDDDDEAHIYNQFRVRVVREGKRVKKLVLAKKSDALRYIPVLHGGQIDFSTQSSFNPPMDMAENDTHTIIVLDVPGCSEQDISVSSPQPNVLMIRGHRPVPQELTLRHEVDPTRYAYDFLFQQRKFGKWEKLIKLKYSVSKSQTKWRVTDGILRIVIKTSVNW